MSDRRATTLSWRAAWAIARRDLHRQFRGLRLLLVCLFLGVGALAAIGSLTGAIQGELDSQGQVILGGDFEVEVYQRPLTEDENAFLERYGELSPGLRMQAMVSAGEAASPVELKAVAPNWPLYGALTLADGSLAGELPQGGAWIAQGVADRLAIGPGDSFTLGTLPLRVAGIIGEEPDRLSEGFTLGQTVIVGLDVPQEAGLTQPGAMYESKTRVRFAGGDDPTAVEEELLETFPESGLDVRTRDRASPGAERFVSRMGEFLTLVGLAALVIAGIGIGLGVASYLQARRAGIATLKILGATSGDIARIYTLQIGAAALAGSLAGLAAGVLVTPLLASALGELLPVDTGFRIDPLALLRALAFGLLVALIFAAPPVLRAKSFPAMALMRERVAPLGAGQFRAALVPVGLGLLGIAALSLVGSNSPLLSAGFLAGAVVLLGLLALLGAGIRSGARKAPRPANPIWRAGLANLHRPGAATGALVTALGFGLSAFVLLAAVQTSLDGNIRRSVPAIAPDYFVLDIPKARVDEFTGMVEEASPGAAIQSTPTLRGQVISFGDPDNPTVVADLEELPEGAWGLSGERGMTYAATVPPGNVVVQGEWWPEIYRGEPLVSVDEDLALAAGLELGDVITVSVLGVQRTATIASMRRLDWESMGFNYVFVFSPNTLADAPHNVAATVSFANGEVPPGLLRQLAQAFPSSSVIEVGPILSEARAILDQVSLAILAAASVAVLAGVAVLLGAIAAARSARIYDTVILRVLGASRGQLLGLQFAEFGLLTALLAGVALALGTGLAWLIVTQLFEFDWLPDWPRIVAVLGAGLVLVLVFSLLASLPVLRAKPAAALRSL